MTSDATSSHGNVKVKDVGLAIALSVFTSQATYYKETNLNAVEPLETPFSFLVTFLQFFISVVTANV